MIGASRLLSVVEPSARSAGCSEAEQAKRRSDRSGLQPRHIAACAQAVSQGTESSNEGKEEARRQHVCGLLDTSYCYFEFGTGNLLATITKKLCLSTGLFVPRSLCFATGFCFFICSEASFPAPTISAFTSTAAAVSTLYAAELNFCLVFLRSYPVNIASSSSVVVRLIQSRFYRTVSLLYE